MLGALYVLEGSRLGAAYLLRTVKTCSDPLISGTTAFLGHGAGRQFWPQYLAALEGHADELAEEDLVRSARRGLRPVRTRGDAVMNKPVDLTNCDREPIHIPGSIQPFGFLLGLQSDFTVCMASENVADYIGRAYTDIFQRPVEDVLSKAAVEAIRARVDYLAGPDASERIFGVPLQDGGKPFDIAIHFSGVYLIIEAEPSVIEHDTNSGEMVRLMVSRIRKTKGVTELAQEAARQLKVLNGLTA